MKRCPRCNRTYTDETLRFCLEDGTALVSGGQVFTDPEATLVGETAHLPLDPAQQQQVQPPPREELPPTEIMGQRGTPTIAVSNAAQTAQLSAPHATQGTAATPRAERPRNTATIVIVSVVGTILLVALGFFGVLVYLKSRDGGGSVRLANTQETRPNTNSNVPANIAPNSNRSNLNGNSNNSNARPSPSPAASPTASPVDATAVASQVTSALNGWAAATTARDIDAHMNYYADTLDTYYNARNVSSSRVRSDRERAFDTYSSMDVQLSNIRVTPDPSGQRATVTFDKTWTFAGDKYSNGSVQQLVTLTKTGGRWRITGEKDLQVYYVNR